MEIEKTKGYGIALSDLEGNWDETFKAKLEEKSQKIIFGHLSIIEKIKLFYWFYIEKKRSKSIDLSDIKSKGMVNTSFVEQQLIYLSMFSALLKATNKERSLKIMYEVMEVTAVEAFSQSSPEHEVIQEYGDSFEFFKRYMRPLPQACKAAGCLEMKMTENSSEKFQYDITWCVWLELAKKMNVPEACLPNCHADDYAYPDYFKSYNIKYSRTGTLAQGDKCCDLRFERII
jgi:hypothetical protein